METTLKENYGKMLKRDIIEKTLDLHLHVYDLNKRIAELVRQNEDLGESDWIKMTQEEHQKLLNDSRHCDTLERINRDNRQELMDSLETINKLAKLVR